MELSEIEVNSLRSELIQYISQILEITQVCVTASIAIIGFGLSRPSHQACLIALLPLLILWPSFTLVLNRRKNVMRVGTYLRAFGGTIFQYEKILRNLRKQEEMTKWPSFHRSIAKIFIILGFISIFVSSFLMILEQLWRYLFVAGIALLFWIGFTYFIKKSESAILMGGQEDDKIYDLWLKSL